MRAQVVERVAVRDDKKTVQARDLSVVGRRIYIEFERWRVNCPQCRSERWTPTADGP